jgi:hypothetical protein
MHLPLLLYTRGVRLHEKYRASYNMILIRTLSLFAYFIYVSIDITIYALRDTPIVFWSLQEHGLSPSRPLLGLSESMRCGTLGTNPCHKLPSA